MAVQQNTDHIQTTHIGSLPRPHKLLDILKAKYGRQPYDETELNSILAQAVTDCVRRQVGNIDLQFFLSLVFYRPGADDRNDRQAS